MLSRRPKLLDFITALKRPPNADVTVGDVGTVVELLPPDGSAVEFVDRDGHPRCHATLFIAEVLTLNRKRTPVGSGRNTFFPCDSSQ